MKQLVLFLGIILLLIIFYSYKNIHALGIPQKINYSGMLTDQEGNPLRNDKYNLSIKIYALPKGGTPVWGPKTLKDMPVNNGNFNVILEKDDNGVPIKNAFMFSENTYLEAEVDGKIITPRQQILSAPYAFVAGATDTVQGTLKVMDTQGNLKVSAGELFGDVFLKTIGSTGNENVRIKHLNRSYSDIEVCAANGLVNAIMYADFDYFGENKASFVTVRNNTKGNGYATMNIVNGFEANDSAAGNVITFGPNGKANVVLTYLNSNPDCGFLSVNDADGKQKAGMFAKDNGAGAVYTLGANGNLNVVLTNYKTDTADYPDNGYVYVANENGNKKAEMYVDANGKGVISADVNNFRMANPLKEGTEIWYACIEGPEVAAYIRGTARLVNGEADVKFPAHFIAVSNPNGITVELTPLSDDSRGLALVDTGTGGFTVKELFNGTGTYDFDYLAMAVRKGHENYQVISPVSISSDMQYKEDKMP